MVENFARIEPIVSTVFTWRKSRFPKSEIAAASVNYNNIVIVAKETIDEFHYNEKIFLFRPADDMSAAFSKHLSFVGAALLNEDSEKIALKLIQNQLVQDIKDYAATYGDESSDEFITLPTRLPYDAGLRASSDPSHNRKSQPTLEPSPQKTTSLDSPVNKRLRQNNLSAFFTKK